jgi:anti-sigma factor RsiW
MNEPDDLNWSAFRYVAGELDEAETRAFESRLESDQDAREAVAQAVALTRCVAAAAAEQASRLEPACELPVRAGVADRTATGRGSTRGWVTAMAVSAALLVLLSQVIRPGGRDEEAMTSTAEAAAQEQLAEVWDSVREPLDRPVWDADRWDDAEAWAEDADAGTDPETALAELPVDDSESYWIEAAVIGLSAAGGEAGQIQ